jgi:hypothetical protein
MLVAATKMEWWQIVVEVMKVGGTERISTIKSACSRADTKDLRFILPHISSNEMDYVLKTAVSRGWWPVAGEVLKVSRSEERHAYAIQEACKGASDKDFELYILPQFSTEQLERVLATAAKTGRWNMISKVLRVSGSDSQSVSCIIEGMCDRGGDWPLRMHILPYCSQEYLRSKLSQFVSRGLWMSVGLVLKTGVTDTQLWSAVEEASKRAKQLDFIQCIVPHCTGAHLDSLLMHLVRRHLWWSVGLVLKRGVSDTQPMEAVKEVSKRADEQDFTNHIVPHCPGDQLKAALTHLVSRGMWKSVGLVLKRGVSDTQHIEAVKEASKRADEQDFIDHILPYGTYNQLEAALTHLVRRRLWMSVRKVLERDFREGQAMCLMHDTCKCCLNTRLLYVVGKKQGVGMTKNNESGRKMVWYP